MVYFVSSPSSSGIPEAVESTIGDGWSGLIILLIVILSGVSFSIVALWIAKKFDGIKDRWFILPGLTAFLVVLTIGMFVFDKTVIEAKRVSADVTAQNIQENFDMQDIAVDNVDNYSDQNKSIVYGSSDGRILEFEVGYSAEHDVMMPIVEPEDLNALPVKEDSTLAQVLETQTRE